MTAIQKFFGLCALLTLSAACLGASFPREPNPGPVDSLFRQFAPNIAFYQGGAPYRFKSVDSLPGVITSSSSDTIGFQPISGLPVSFYFALPAGLTLKSITNVGGEVMYFDNSTPRGADQVLSIRAKGTVIAGFIWKISPHPIEVQLAPYLTIKQLAGDSLCAAAVSGRDTVIVTHSHILTIKVGGKTYNAYVHTNVHRIVPAAMRGEDVSTGYILRAIIVSADTH